MGWFGRTPRKVGFGVTEAKPTPPRPRQYQYAKPKAQSRAWDAKPVPTPVEKPSGTDLLNRRDTTPEIPGLSELRAIYAGHVGGLHDLHRLRTFEMCVKGGGAHLLWRFT